MKKDSNGPFKNYIILAITLILTIVLVIYFYMWYNKYEENKLNTPIMDKYLQVINYNELDNYLMENDEAVIYISVLENENIRNFEKKFKILANDYSLKNKILYMDLTDEINSGSKNEMKEKYNFIIPSISIFKDGTLKYMYDIKENNYDINLLKSFLLEEGIIND